MKRADPTIMKTRSSREGTNVDALVRDYAVFNEKTPTRD